MAIIISLLLLKYMCLISASSSDPLFCLIFAFSSDPLFSLSHTLLLNLSFSSFETKLSWLSFSHLTSHQFPQYFCWISHTSDWRSVARCCKVDACKRCREGKFNADLVVQCKPGLQEKVFLLPVPMLCACKKEQSANMRQHPGKEIFLKGRSERDRHVTSNFEAWDLREPLAQQFQIDTALASCSRVFAFFQLRCPGCRKDPQGKPTRMVMPSFPVHVHGPTEYWKQRSYMAGLNSATHSRLVH